MQRISTPEILDSEQCPPAEVERSLNDLCRVNRWFGGVTTTRRLIERVSQVTGCRRFSALEVGSGFGEVPKAAGMQLRKRGIDVEFTLLDRMRSHLRRGNRSVVADGLALPFPDASFDLVSCNLFAHHLEPETLVQFVNESLRVSRSGVLINDLIRHPLHLALVYAGFPLLRSPVSRFDGVASVKRAYQPEEMRKILATANGATTIEISRHYLFRMGVIVWRKSLS